MNNQVQNLQGNQVTQQGGQVSKFDSFRSSISDKKQSIEKVLPSHISFEKFQSVVLTSCMQNPDLLNAHRPSMMLACVKAATDGLLPDGRDAALVIFNSKVGKDDSGRPIWGQKVQYMPMYSGILKKVRQSEELASISTQVVYSKDKFEHRLGDDDAIIHSVVNGDDRGEFYAVYCIAKLKDGTVMKEVMYKSEVEKVRRTSKSGADKNTGEPIGIWKDWYEEMAKKTVFRRLAKWLPQSVDKEGNEIRLFDQDDSMEIMDQHEESVTWDEDGEITAEGNAQPDLKQIAAERKAASNADEKEEVAAKEPEQSKPDQENVASGAQDNQSPSHDNGKTLPTAPKNYFPGDQPSLFDMERKIREVVTAATDHADLHDKLTVDFADDLKKIKEGNAGAFNVLNKFIENKLNQLEASV